MHGKNHHKDGSFCRHVTELQILMADGIAQALSTTMLGLAVAIPLLIGQRWLLAQSNRHVRHLDALALWLTAESLSHSRRGASNTEVGNPA